MKFYDSFTILLKFILSIFRSNKSLYFKQNPIFDNCFVFFAIQIVDSKIPFYYYKSLFFKYLFIIINLHIYV